MSNLTDGLDKVVAKMAEKTGKIRMQKRVLEWALAHRDSLQQASIDSLIRVMEEEVEREGS